MQRADEAKARHHTYLLLSRLYLHGVTDDLLPYISEIPELREACSPVFSRDEAGAAHNQVFAHDISPYESIFLDASGLLGGIHAAEVKSCYQSAGVSFRSAEDDIGHELAFLSVLCKAEGENLQAGDLSQATRYQVLQESFMRDHLLRWLSPFVIALSFSGQVFFQKLGELTWSFVCDHWAVVCRDQSNHSPYAFLDSKEPPLSDLLHENSTNLNQITAFLVIPSRCGFFFGQRSISELALRNQLPRGFGSRRQILSNLFRSAAQYELVPELLNDVINCCDEWRFRYQQQVESCPLLEPFIAVWQKQVELTTAALSTMKTRLEETTFS